MKKEQILEELLMADGYLSGEELGRKMNCTRAAVSGSRWARAPPARATAKRRFPALESVAREIVFYVAAAVGCGHRPPEKESSGFRV